jgi:uncharacterized protein
MLATTAAPSFVADVMLGRLAKTLRMLGYDVAYRSDASDDAVKLLALREGRVVLTRDREIAATGLPIRVVLVEGDRVPDQLRHVVRALGLSTDDGRLFTRCLLCNEPVAEVPAQDVGGRVPPYVHRTQTRFVRCPSCGRIYWAATHVERARKWLRSALGA